MRVKLLNTYVDNLNMIESIDRVNRFINDGKYHYVVTPNVDHIVRLEKDSEFKKVYKEADLILTDGMPLVWISKFNKTPVKEKVSGSDLFPYLCELSEKNRYRMFLLGGAEGVADLAKKNLTSKYRNLNIVGTHSPSFGFENNQKEIDDIISIIREAKPDILILGLGSPKQEKLIHKYLEAFKVPITFCIGAAIDFEAKVVKRAPLWMQKSGLEWFYRFLKEPRRMFKRYFVDDLKIIFIFLKYRKMEKNR
ncbi:WecB/TagA/CpsF family glycosyltransferase [Clostridium intestinale]|uniref:Teichoic acid biosynthesis protein, tagA n=1 Tax=Clostridium intestinale URNW TaxID=1294142 RepID=U2Q0B9_9CLOT|nr:WecB/TagA/CpsF family glycosyltransferase [Clostridium intestinale]ERK32200.1 Teichoic acid biosynthesis protein, tagA [Clostridium intestinale URNW]